jgi:DNA excision repair protein ERCC-4
LLLRFLLFLFFFMARALSQRQPETFPAAAAIMRSAMLIEIDDREIASPAAGALARIEGVAVEVRRLLCGDYCVDGRLFVERKTARNFSASVRDNRMFLQAARLAGAPGFGLVIIEGSDFYGDPSSAIPKASVMGAVACLIVAWGIPVLFSGNPGDTAAWIVAAGRQAGDLSSRRAARRPGVKPRSRRKLMEFLLQGLPGVGPDRAGRLLERFGTIEKVMTATEDELRAAAGIGEKTAHRIRALVTARAEQCQAGLCFADRDKQAS